MQLNQGLIHNTLRTKIVLMHVYITKYTKYPSEYVTHARGTKHATCKKETTLNMIFSVIHSKLHSITPMVAKVHVILQFCSVNMDV